MKKNAEFLSGLFRHDLVPVEPDVEVGFGTLELLSAVGVEAELVGDLIRFTGDNDAIAEAGDLLDEYAPAIRAALEVGWKFPWEDDDAEQRGLIVVNGTTWVRRPDHDEHFGWEPASLPPADRWWRGCGFEELPDPPKSLVVGSLPKPKSD